MDTTHGKSRQLVFHIGYHKTGTTWLQQHLFANEGNNFVVIGGAWEARQDIVAPRSLDFQPEDVRAKYAPMLERAWAVGAVPIFTDERFSGQPFSGGFDSKEIADRIHALYPEARIVIVIREQRRMLYSTYDEYVKEGGVASIETFLHPRRRHVLPQFRFEHFMYDRLISYYQNLFGKERILVLPFEQFQTEPYTFLANLTEFCGIVVERPSDPSRKSNPGSAPFLINLRRRLNYFLRCDELNGQSHLYIPYFNYYFTKILPGLVQVIPGFLNHYSREKIQRVINEAIGGMFEASNRATAELTNLDLLSLGYEMKGDREENRRGICLRR